MYRAVYWSYYERVEGIYEDVVKYLFILLLNLYTEFADCDTGGKYSIIYLHCSALMFHMSFRCGIETVNYADSFVNTIGSKPQARIQGGGGKGAPPPPFSGEKNKGPKTTHTEKKGSKSDNHEARYRLKRTSKHTKYAQIF